MKVLRYTQEVKKQVNAKLNPEPWMHIGIMNDGNYAIYVWDTRQMLEHGKIDPGKVSSIAGKPAMDNKKPVRGASKEFNEILATSGRRKREKCTPETATVFSLIDGKIVFAKSIDDLKTSKIMAFGLKEYSFIPMFTVQDVKFGKILEPEFEVGDYLEQEENEETFAEAAKKFANAKPNPGIVAKLAICTRGESIQVFDKTDKAAKKDLMFAYDEIFTKKLFV